MKKIEKVNYKLRFIECIFFSIFFFALIVLKFEIINLAFLIISIILSLVFGYKMIKKE